MCKLTVSNDCTSQPFAISMVYVPADQQLKKIKGPLKTSETPVQQQEQFLRQRNARKTPPASNVWSMTASTLQKSPLLLQLVEQRQPIASRQAVPSSQPPVEQSSRLANRREKSRVAAQSRRSKECSILTGLQRALPLSQHEPGGLEKAVVIRIASQVLALYNNFSEVLGKTGHDCLSLQSNCLIGIVIDRIHQHIIYAPPSLALLTGHPWSSLIGMSVQDLVGVVGITESDKVVRIKMATGAPSRTRCGATVATKSTSANYVLAFCWGLTPISTNTQLAVVILQPIIADNVMTSGSEACLAMIRQEQKQAAFCTFHDGQLNITEANDNCFQCVGYQVRDLIGRSLFDLVHLDDVFQIKTSIDSLDTQQLVVSGFYRFRTNLGEFRWTKTTFYRPQIGLAIICRHDVAHLFYAPDNCDHVEEMLVSPDRRSRTNCAVTHTTPAPNKSSLEDLLCCSDVECIEDCQPVKKIDIQIMPNRHSKMGYRAPRIDDQSNYLSIMTGAGLATSLSTSDLSSPFFYLPDEDEDTFFNSTTDESMDAISNQAQASTPSTAGMIGSYISPGHERSSMSTPSPTREEADHLWSFETQDDPVNNGRKEKDLEYSTSSPLNGDRKRGFPCFIKQEKTESLSPMPPVYSNDQELEITKRQRMDRTPILYTVLTSSRTPSLSLIQGSNTRVSDQNNTFAKSMLPNQTIPLSTVNKSNIMSARINERFLNNNSKWNK